MTSITKIIAPGRLICRHSCKCHTCVVGFFIPVRFLHTTSQLLRERRMAPVPRKHEATLSNVNVRGVDLLRNPRLNKGSAFTLAERYILGIHGLLPPHVFTINEQAQRILDNFRNLGAHAINQYVYLAGLQDRNEKLFYKFVTENIAESAPILYTPTVGEACQHLGFVFRKARGLYITINDLGHVYDVICNCPDEHIKAIVVTDGERILGLGDLGAYGMGIPIGKLSLYTAMGGIPPGQCLPVMIDVGTDNENLLEDSSYFGLRHKRIRGPKYNALIDEFMQAVVHRYGQDTLIQFEDFANINAFRFLERYQNKYLTFNDDIQGTAAVVVAGLIGTAAVVVAGFMSAMRITKKRLSDNVFLFFGAGEASIGISTLLVAAMEQEGITKKNAEENIWLIDKYGLLVENRPAGELTPEKQPFLKKCAPMESLMEICKFVKPSVAIGAAGVGSQFTKEFLGEMASINERPVIFALSNPTSHSECTAQEAYDHTQGRCVFASGSPFPKVTYQGKTYTTGQGNNAYIFPGIALGVIVARMHHVNHSIFLIAAQVIAGLVKQEDLDIGLIYPPMSNIHEVSTVLGAKVVEHAYKTKTANTYPEPVDKDAFVRGHQYSLEYESFVPNFTDWLSVISENAKLKLKSGWTRRNLTF